MGDRITKIEQDFQKALKNKNDAEVAAYRLIKSAFIHKSKETGQPLSEEQALFVLQILAKRHRESIDAYRQANRRDLVEPEESQLKVVSLYLPKALTYEDIQKEVQDILSRWPLEQAKDFGSVMGAVMKQFKGRADGADVAEAVKRLLHTKNGD